MKCMRRLKRNQAREQQTKREPERTRSHLSLRFAARAQIVKFKWIVHVVCPVPRMYGGFVLVRTCWPFEVRKGEGRTRMSWQDERRAGGVE